MIDRPYQKDSEAGIQQKFFEKFKKVLLVLFMGLGKTHVASNMVKRAVANNKRVIFIAHRSFLVSQAVEKFESEGLQVGVIMDGFKEERWKPVQVASIQSLKNRELPPAHLVIIDEAHRSISVEYLKVNRVYEERGAYFIGLTATPFRTRKKEAFNIFWDDYFRPITISEAIEQGYVCQSKVYACARIVAAGMATSEGEFDKRELMKAFHTDEVYVNLVNNYNELIGKDKSIVFCVNKEHAKKTCEVLIEAGYRAVAVDSDTDPKERVKIIEDYKAGYYDALVNIDIFTEGFDCPDIMAVVLNMATTSKSKYFQCAGRGSRILPDGSKSYYKILDMADNTIRFGFVEDDYEISLESTEVFNKPGVAPVKDCPYCGYMMHASAKICPECKKELPVKPPVKKTIKEEKFIEMVRKEIEVQPFLDYTKDQWKDIPSHILPMFAKTNKLGAKWVRYQLAARGEGDKVVKIKNYKKPDIFKQEAWLQKAYHNNIPIDAAKWGSPTITATELIFEYKLEN